MLSGGWLGESDRSYFEEQTKKIDQANLSEYFNYSEAPTLEEKKAFFSKIDVFTMAGETVQSLLVPSTFLGRELLDLVLPAQAHHGSVAKLLHGVSAINKSAPISAQGITDCARLTLLRVPISEQRRKAVVRKITTGFPYELSEEEEEDALNSITELSLIHI